MKKCTCNCEVFVTKLEVVAQIQLGENGEVGIVAVDDANIRVIEKVICANCNKEYTKEELLSKPCSRCGELFANELINANGMCSQCQSIVDRFSNLSQDDLIAMVLKLEQDKNKAKPSRSKAKSAKKKEEEVQTPVAVEPSIAEQPTEQPAQEPVVQAVNNLGNTNLLNGIDMTQSFVDEDITDSVDIPVTVDPANDLIPSPTSQEIPITSAPMDFNSIFPGGNNSFGTLDLNNVGDGFRI